MTLGIDYKQQSQVQQLRLVYSPPVLLSQGISALSKPVQDQLVAQLAAALICRMWIPQGPTIVGLLGVGSSRSNRDEILKWVEREIGSIKTGEPQHLLAELCRRFLQVIDDRMTDIEFVRSGYTAL